MKFAINMNSRFNIFQNPSPTLSSSADSAIGGSSPSSCCNTSTNGSVEWHPQQSSLRMNYFIVPDKDLAEDRTDFTPTSCQIELNCDIINEHLQKVRPKVILGKVNE